jgi:phosphate-selective porin OprO/OprP
MKRTLLALTLALSMTAPAFAQDFAMGEETKGLKVKISDDTDFSIRIRMQPRFDMGDMITSKDGNSYESDTDMYLRRLRLEMNGKLMPNLKYDLTLEMDKNGKSGKASASAANEVKVQYAYLDYKFDDAANLRFGKAKLPYSRVSLTSSSKQLLIERPVTTEAAKKLFDDYYQTNAMLHGSFAEGMISYNLATADGWENGNTIYDKGKYNSTDTATTKVFKADPLYVARVEVSPPGFVEKGKSDAWLGQGQHLTLGFSYALQKSIEYAGLATDATTTTNAAAVNQSEDRTLMGADISAHFGGLTLQGEYTAWKIDYSIAGKDAKEPKGWYAQAGYFIPGINIEPVVRYEIYDHNSNAAAGADDTEEKDTTIGVNWYGKGHSFKIGANWVNSSYGKNASGYLANADKKDVYQVQAQLYF